MGYIKELRKLVGPIPLMMVGAAVLVLDQENRILLQKRRDNGCWGLPGGSLELGESIEEAAKREVEEEVGLKVNQLALFNIFSGVEMYYRYPNGDQVYNVCIAYICQTTESKVQVSDESSEAMFFSHNDLPTEISPPDRPIIERFLQEKSVTHFDKE